MQIEIVDDPIRISLVGYGGKIGGEPIAAVGKRLMDRMWREIQSLGIKTKGINHWVYLPESTIFTGVELASADLGMGKLQVLSVSLNRYVKHVHTGPYSELPLIWPQLFDAIKRQEETPTYPNLEIYGHWNSVPAKCETTILIALQADSVDE